MSSELNSANRSRVVSRRRTSYKARNTIFAPACQLPAGYVDKAERVFIVGHVADTIAGLREWVATTPEGYVPDPRGHYMQGRGSWAARYIQLGSGRKVELRPASQWFGDSTDVGACDAAWSMLEYIGRNKFNQGQLLASPAVTGRDWWVRTLPGGLFFESPPDEICELIRSTSGQGRFEVLPGSPTVDAIHQMDGRLMYLGLMRELPGNFHSLGPCSIGEVNTYDRARYEVTVTVPRDWKHVGLVGRYDRGLRKTDYPNSGVCGTQWKTWVDGSELRLLIKYKWPLVVHQRMLFEQGKPLDKFARDVVKAIVSIKEASPAAHPAAHLAAHLAVRALRLIAISTLGSFVGRGTMVDKEAKLWDGPLPSTARNVSTVDGTHFYQELKAFVDPSMAQPHWAAAVWARARCRLLDGPGNSGALHVPMDTVIGMALDALYLTVVPNWEDDGTPGRFRLKSSNNGAWIPMPNGKPGLANPMRPTNMRELLR